MVRYDRPMKRPPDIPVLPNLGGPSIRKFSCLGCGRPFDAHPPDDVHTVADRDHHGFIVDCVRVNHLCQNTDCKERENPIYWFAQQPYVVAATLVSYPTGSYYNAGLYNYHPSGSDFSGL